jgi:hypothetical protein
VYPAAYGRATRVYGVVQMEVMEPICDMHLPLLEMRMANVGPRDFSLGYGADSWRLAEEVYQCPNAACGRYFHHDTAYISVPNSGNNRDTIRCACADGAYWMAITSISQDGKKASLECLKCGGKSEMPL